MSLATDDIFALSRLFVPANTRVEQFAQLLAGRGPQLAPAYERARAWAWRTVRASWHVLKPEPIQGNYHGASYA